MKKKSASPSDVPAANKALRQLDVKIDEFGQIVRNVNLEQINEFLDETVPDKKLETNEAAEPLEPGVQTA